MSDVHTVRCICGETWPCTVRRSQSSYRPDVVAGHYVRPTDQRRLQEAPGVQEYAKAVEQCLAIKRDAEGILKALEVHHARLVEGVFYIGMANRHLEPARDAVRQARAWFPDGEEWFKR